MSAQEVPSDLSYDAPEPAARASRLEARRRRRARIRSFIPVVRVAMLGAFLGVWEVGARVSLGERPVIDPFLWSQPSKIGTRIWQWLGDGTVFNNIWVTLYEAAGGYLIGMALGITAGFLLGNSDYWARVFQPFLQALNAIPRIIFAPLFFIVFGLGESSKIALGAMVIFFVAFWNAFLGVRDVDRNVFNNARMLGANRRQMTRHVLLPSAMAWILSSLHLAVGFAMGAAIVGEYLGSTRGLGHIVARSEGNFDQTGVLAGIFTLSAAVVVVEFIVAGVEKRLLKWKPQASADLLTT